MRGRRWRVRVCAVCLAAAGMAGGAAAQDEAAFAIREVDGRGDTAVAEAEGLLEPWRRALIGRSWTAAAIQEQARQLRDALRERGYPLASVRTPPADYRNGRVPFEIDAGRFGRLTLTDPDGAPFSGRWFRESQLRARLSGMAEGEPFEESVFYRHILGINTHSDLIVDPTIRVRKETAADGTVRRYADLVCAVTETRPLHAVATVDNTGLEETGEWRATLLVQHLNLTRRDDILSLWIGPVSADAGSSRSAAAGYYRPWLSGRGGHLLAYGGYSDVETAETAGCLTLRGKGWFGGLQAGWRLAAVPSREVVLTAGVAWRNQEETLSLRQDGVSYRGDARTVGVMPLTLGLQIIPLRTDGWGGRTFCEVELVGGTAGIGSDEADLEAFRPGAEASYLVGRLRLARLQPLGRRAETRSGDAWLLFGRVDAQAANGALLGAEQVGLGGMETVRGFPERAVMGDQGGRLSLELRTPLIDAAGGIRLQGVLFADAGHAAQEGDQAADPITIAGAGAGLRLGWGAHVQIQADLAAPLTGVSDVEARSEEEVGAVRAHLRAVAQF